MTDEDRLIERSSPPLTRTDLDVMMHVGSHGRVLRGADRERAMRLRGKALVARSEQGLFYCTSAGLAVIDVYYRRGWLTRERSSS